MPGSRRNHPLAGSSRVLWCFPEGHHWLLLGSGQPFHLQAFPIFSNVFVFPSPCTVNAKSDPKTLPNGDGIPLWRTTK